MANTDHGHVIRRFFAEIDQGNFAVIDELISPDFVGHFPATPGPIDREALRQFLGMLHNAFPDGEHRFDEQLAQGDKIVSRWTFQGTHRGDFQGIPQGLPATGKSVSMTGITVERIVNGQVTETWAQWDALGMLQQLGVMPGPEQLA